MSKVLLLVNRRNLKSFFGYHILLYMNQTALSKSWCMNTAAAAVSIRFQTQIHAFVSPEKPRHQQDKFYYKYLTCIQITASSLIVYLDGYTFFNITYILSDTKGTTTKQQALLAFFGRVYLWNTALHQNWRRSLFHYLICKQLNLIFRQNWNCHLVNQNLSKMYEKSKHLYCTTTLTISGDFFTSSDF